MPKQMRRFTCNVPLKEDSRCRRGTTPGFSQILNPGLLSFTGVVLGSNLHSYTQQDGTNTIRKMSLISAL